MHIKTQNAIFECQSVVQTLLKTVAIGSVPFHLYLQYNKKKGRNNHHFLSGLIDVANFLKFFPK